jgi:hypothetical protein
VMRTVLQIDMNEKLEEIANTRPEDKSKWGPMAWKALHTVCEAIPCKSCSDHCHRMVDFEHDLVNAHLGKPIHDMENVQRYLATITEELVPVVFKK